MYCGGPGRLAMAWFGGSREGARDVQIYFSRFDGERWEGGRALISTDGFIASTGRYITKLGNPVLHADGSRLNLWFVAVSLGGWGGARLNHSWSDDQGQTWSVPRLVVTSPFLNVSTLVRSTAISSAAFARSDGKVSRETLLPAYFELGRKYPVMSNSASTGPPIALAAASIADRKRRSTVVNEASAKSGA